MISSAGNRLESNAAGEIAAGVVVAGAHGQTIDGVSRIDAECGVKIASNCIEDERSAVGWVPAIPNRVPADIAVVVGFVQFFGRADVIAGDRSSHAR